MAAVEKGRYSDAEKRRLYPVSTFNSWSARPLSALLANLGFTPNLVSLLSLVASLVGFWLVATSPTWLWLVGGALLVHLGLVLDHADGQVARRRGTGSTWGMYLDMCIDRVVEIGLVASLLLAGPVRDAPAWLPAELLVLGPEALPLVAVLAVGAMMLWRFLTSYNDVLFLRSHLLQKRALPDLAMRPQSVARRPLVPWVFNRDWVILIWLVGVVVGQFHATLAVLLLAHLLMCVEKMVVFRVRHPEPEGDAARILDPDYH